MRSAIRFISLTAVLLQFLLLIYSASFATKYYSRGAGNWSTNATWSTTAFNGAAAAAYPGQSSANDTAYISGYVVTADVSPANSVRLISITQTNGFSSADTKLQISTAGITLRCAEFSMVDNNVNSHMDLAVSSSAIFQVNGNVVITRSTANTRDKRMQVLISNTARMNVTGSFTYTFGRANSGTGQGNEIQLDNSGRLDITGALIMTIGNNNGSNNPLNLVMNGTSILNAGSVSQTVSNSNDGDDIFINLNGGTMTVSGTWYSTVASTATSTNSLTLYIDGGTLSTQNFTFFQNGGGTGDMSIFMNQGSTAAASSLTVNGNLQYLHDDGDNMEIETNANSSFTVTGKFVTTINTPSNGDIVLVDLNGGTFSIADSLTATMNSNTNYFEIFIDGATMTAKGIKFDQQGTGNGDMLIYMNNTSTASAATLTVGTYGLQFLDNGGDNMDIELHANSFATINGNVTFNNNAASGNDRLMIKTYNGTPIPSITINGNFTGNLNTGININDQIYLDINNGTFNCTGNMTFTTAAGCLLGSHCAVEIDGNATVFTVGGTIALNHLGGSIAANDVIDIGTNSGAPVFSAGGLTLNGQATNTTRFKMADASIATINGDVTLTSSSAGNVLIDLNGTSVFQIKGNFIRSAVPNRFGKLTCAANTTVKYIGTTNTQVIAGDAGNGGDGFSYENLVINNTYSVIPQLSMNAIEGNATIPGGGSLTLTSGVISSLSSAMIVIGDNATSTQGNASCYIDGPVKKVGNSPNSFVFPVGDGTVWARLAISDFKAFSGTTEFMCQYHYVAPSNNMAGFMGTAVGPRLDHVSRVEYWDLQRTFDAGSSATCDVTLYWEDSTRSGIRTISDLRVANYHTSATNQWENHGLGSSTSSGTGGTITSSVDLSIYTPVTFGSWSGVNPLPVELVSFDAISKDNKTAILKWETASQVNNDYFTIEKSKDGIIFEELTKIDGQGNSTQQMSYEAKDADPFIPVTYYRLKQTDFNGTFSYSDIKSIRIYRDDFDLLVYPNPSKGIFNVENRKDDSNVNLFIADIHGNSLLQKNFSSKSFLLDLTGFKPGVYLLKAVSENSTENIKLVIQ